MTHRYARQEAISGWDQDRLSDATIAVAGSGPAAFLSVLMATAMGMGRLVWLEGGTGVDGLPSFLPLDGLSWSDFFARINPRVKVFSYPVRLRERLIRKLPALDGLIVAGNDLLAWKAAWLLAQDTSIPVVAGNSAGLLGVWGSVSIDRVVARFHQRPESPLLSQIVAGLLVEEIRKILLPLPGETGRTDRRNLLSLSSSRTVRRYGHLSTSLQRNHLALVGAGALGTWFGLALGLSGLPAVLNIFDDDEIGETNLNRQILFFDAIGQAKAPILAERLQGLFPRLTLCGFGIRVDADSSRQIVRNSIIVACPDNFKARALLNDMARHHRRMLVNGGTSAMGGSCMVYEPGRTACLDCRMRVHMLARQEDHPWSCAQVEASVVTSNAITGALMVWALREMIAGQVQPGVWEYDGCAREDRIGLHSVRLPCRCHLG